MTRYEGLPPLPERIRRLDELAANLWWSWQYARARCSATSTISCGDRPPTTPCGCCGWSRASGSSRCRAIRSSSRRTTTRSQGLDAAYAARNTWMARRFPEAAEHDDRVLLGRVRHPSVPADLRRRSGRARRATTARKSSDLGVPLVGVGFMYPQGYFHQTVSPEGWQLEVYERLNWPDVAIEQALKPDGSPCIVAVPLGDRAVLTNVWQVSVGRVESVPARHGPRRERAAGSRAVRAALRRRSRDASAAGDHSRHRRRPRAARARHRAFRLAPERGARRVRRPSAHLRAHRRRHELRRGARGGAGGNDLHDAHAGRRRPRRIPVRRRRTSSPGGVGPADRSSRTIPRARRISRAVQHDRPRAADIGLREWREPAAR